MIVELNDENFQSYVNRTNTVVIVFSAAWCSPCTINAEIYEEIQKEYSDNKNITFCKINVDNSPISSSEWSIKRIPHTIIFKKGIEFQRIEGVLIKEDFIKILEKSLE